MENLKAMGTGSGTSNRRASQVGALVCLCMFVAVLWAPPALTQTPKKTEVGTAVESWYHTEDEGVEPPAPLPVPVPVAPEPVNPYGENTLHVAIAGGQEEARTYIALDLAKLPATFEVGEASLTLPIDPGGATLNPETSRVQVCLSDLPAKSQEGSFEEPPEVDCKTKTPATYAKEPFPHLEADITKFGEDLAFSGLVILPSERAVEKQDTWHVTFYGKKNEAEGAKPITAELTVLPPEDPFADDDFVVPDTPDGEEGAAISPPVSGTSEAPSFDVPTSSAGPSLDSGTAPETPATEEPVDTGDQPVAAGPELELAAEVEPAYTIVWALPLLLLALSLYLGSALTRDVVVRHHR